VAGVGGYRYLGRKIANGSILVDGTMVPYELYGLATYALNGGGDKGQSASPYS